MFKVGDRVEVKGYAEGWDGEGAVEECSGGYVVIKFDREFPRNRGGFPPKYVHKIDNPSPVRAVTRREIVPGTYGKINVLAASKRSAVIQLLDGTGGKATKAIAFTAEELRETVHIFNQLAEALEDKS